MAADVQIPPNFQKPFKGVNDNLSDGEKDSANQIFKQIYGDKINLDEKDFLKTQKELYRLGVINDDDGLSILSPVTQNASKKQQIQKIIDKCKPDEKSRFVGRENEKKEICSKLNNVKLNIPGLNLFGESGVGKTKLAQEVVKSLPDFKGITVDFRDIADVSNVNFHVLDAFGLPSFDKDKHRIFFHLKKKLQTKTLLVLDNIDQLLDGDFKDDFLQFIYEVISSEACKTGSLKILLTSVKELQDRKLKGKFFSDYKVNPLPKEVSQNLISFPEKQILTSPEEEDVVLSEITKLCKNLPYLLQAARQMIREGSKGAAEVLERLQNQIENKVPEKYACILEQFESIPNHKLQHLAVKISLLRRPFSVETAMKIAGLELTKDNKYNATIDIELLSIHKVISKADEKEAKFEIHSLFQEFVRDYLICEQSEEYKQTYAEGEVNFFQHFSGRMIDIAKCLDTDFINAYNTCEIDKANFELAIDISKFNNEVFDTLLHSDEHNELALVGVLFEVMKDSDERKQLFRNWAEMAEKSGKWITSVNLRSWQAMQGTDLESTLRGNQALQIAERSFKKAQEAGVGQDQLNAAKSLMLYSRGRLQWQEATKMAISSDKHKDQNRIDLINQGLSNLKEALNLRRETVGDENNTMTARTLNLIGNCYMELNEPDEAEGFYLEALEMKRQLIGSEDDLHWEMPTYYNQIAQVHGRRGTKIEKSWWGFLQKSKYKAEYAKSVEWMEKALKREEALGVGDTEHTATFHRNTANALIALGEYDRALEYGKKCHKAREERYGQHPETVKILYLIGIVHEYRKDRKAACMTYEEAFEMEENLSHNNHSSCREKIRERLNEMYKALKMEEKQIELQNKIENIDAQDVLEQDILEQEKDFAREIPFKEEVYINVNQEGGTYDCTFKGFVLSIPENCISQPTKITHDRSPNLPSPLNPREHLVSSVVRLGPSSIELEKSLKMTLMHCGPRVEDGYENIVKVFDEEKQVWQEHKATQQAAPPPVKLTTDYLDVQLTKLTAVAVVTRLITDTIEVTVDGCDVTSSWCSDIRLSFPRGAVDRTITGQMQVLPIANHLISDPTFAPLLVLLFHGFKDIIFNKPVLISLPFKVKPKREDIRLWRTSLDDISLPMWEDITNKDDLAQIKVEDNKVEIKIQKFCALCVCNAVTDIKKVLPSQNNIINNPPRSVSFAAYQRHGESSNTDRFNMKLTCVANNKQLGLTKELLQQGYVLLEESTAEQPMRMNDRAYINVRDIDKSKWRNNVFLKFLGEEEFRKPFIVKTVKNEVELEFYPQKIVEDIDENGDPLCELSLMKPPPVDVQDDNKQIWVEYCGIEFTALQDLPSETCSAVYHLFSGNDKIQGRLLNCGKDKKWSENGLEIVLSLLHQVSFDDVHSALEEYFQSEAPGSTYLPSLLRLLSHGHKLTHTQLDQIDSTVGDKISAFSTQISPNSYITFGRGLGLSEEVLDTYSSPSEVLQYWSENYTESNIDELFNALRGSGEKGPARDLARTITELAKRLTKQDEERHLHESTV